MCGFCQVIDSEKEQLSISSILYKYMQLPMFGGYGQYSVRYNFDGHLWLVLLEVVGRLQHTSFIKRKSFYMITDHHSDL